MTETVLRPRRSCLYMPGANARALEKARALDADVIILDLEDSVAPDAKHEARDRVCEAVRQRGYGSREVVVRINALESLWGQDDLSAVLSARPDAVLIPKLTGADDVIDANDLISEHGEAEVAIWGMIETPAAVLNIAEIAATASSTRLAAFVVGPNDLLKDMGARPTPGRSVLHTALSLTVMAARANGLVAIDGVYNDIADPVGLRAECDQGRDFGFDGKSLIHPSQLDIANSVFAPAEAELEDARRVIAAFALPENRDKGVIKVEGRMVERLHLEQARRLIAIADAINASR